MIDLDDLILTDDDLREIHRAWELRLLRLKHPYVFDLIRVLAKFPKCPRGYVLDMLWRNRKYAGLPIPPEFESSAQRALEYYCRDSDVFKKRNVPVTDALFHWPEGKGAGVWALLPENARAWVKANRERVRERLANHRI